jgi:zinc D-Ala-D-Ala dipeptidase
MHGFFKFNFITFAAVLIALVFCIPLLGIDNPAKAVEAKHTSSSSSSAPVEDEIDAKLKASGLVNVQNMGSDFAVDQRYGTTNNFTGAKIYQSKRVYLRPETAQKLVDANKEFNSLEYKIKIWDAYRPMSVQFLLYTKAPSDLKYFIANPYTPESCTHNRGTAVDITLVHLDGSPVEMPTDFDTFSFKADSDDNSCTKQAAANRALLKKIMQKHGFGSIECEWWHFNDTDTYKYNIIDVMF